MSIRLHTLPAHCVLLAPAHLHHSLRFTLCEQGGALHITLLTMSAFFQRRFDEEIDTDTVLMQYRESLMRYESKRYRTMIHSLDFLKQCAALIEDMKLYGITPDDLPTGNDAQCELQTIIQRLYPIRTRQDLENAVWEQLKQEDVSHIVLVDAIVTAQDDVRYARFQALGASILKQEAHTPHVTYTKTMNKRKEVEVLAQRIIREQIDASSLRIAVCDPSYQPLLKQVFTRYHIPLTVLQEQMNDPLHAKAILFLRYAWKQDMETLLELLEMHALPVSHQKPFCDYVRLFAKQLSDSFDHVRAYAHPSQLLDEQECKRLMELEEKAAACKAEITLSLEGLFKAEDGEALLLEVDRLLRNTISVNDQKQIASLAKIQALFQAFLPYYHKRDDLGFLIELCADHAKGASQSDTLCGAWISSLPHMQIGGEIGVVLGCTQKNYPGFVMQKGLFDEAYCKQIAKYPRMDVRYRQYLDHLRDALHSFPKVYVSYPMGTYEGKTNESALELEQLFPLSAEFCEPDTIYHRLQRDETLSSDTAHSLFVHNDLIQGSVSSFEQYMRCPYSYFLKYGLKLRQPLDYQFSGRRIGTLAHFILEQAVNQYGKQYTEISASDVAQILSDELQAFADVYITWKAHLPILQKRLLYAVMSNLHDLQDMEQHSHLAPTACEHEFYETLDLENGTTLRLHGFIDRLDENQDFIRIIDYKSSAKTLKEDQVFAGLQLQLPIYALYAKHHFGKRVLGAFYHSLKKETIHAPAGKITRRPIAYVRFDETDWEMMRREKQRLQGWIMDDSIEVMDDNGTHIAKVRQNKDGEIKTRNIYDIEQMETWMNDIIKQIAVKIMNGEMMCQPAPDACTFCPYHEVCRFDGYEREVKPLVDLSVLQEKEDE